MKTRQLPRYRWYFYSQSETLDQYGERSNTTYTPQLSGFFSKELARKPIEILDASDVESEVQYVLLGPWIKLYRTAITAGMFCWCPVTDEVYEVLAKPVDHSGDQKRVAIYIVDNVERSIDTSQLSTEYTN